VLTGFVSTIRASQAELTNLLASTIQEAESALVSKGDKELGVFLESLRETTLFSSTYVQNLGALLSEKIAKQVVSSTKGALNM